MKGTRDFIAVALVGMIAACAPLVLVGWGVMQSMSWMEERFGPDIAALAAFAFIGVAVFAGGVLLNQRNTKHTLDAVADFQASNAEIYRANAGVDRERARLEREQFKFEARAAFDDTKRIEQYGRRYAGMLMDVQRQEQPRQEQQPAAQWVTVGDDDTYRHYQ
jgi:hypothetical protein